MSDTGVFITRGIMIKTCMKELKVWYNLDMRQINYFEAYLDDFDKIVIYMSKQSYEGNSRLFYLEDASDKLQRSHQLVQQTVCQTNDLLHQIQSFVQC